MNGRPWQDWERDLLRAEYRRVPPAELARRLGRTVGQVYQGAAKLGLSTPRPVFTPGMEATLRRRHAEDWTDKQIADELGIDRRWLRERRVALGLPVAAVGVLEARRQAVRTQYERLGVANGGELRKRSFAKYACENGWPEDLRPREVQILNVLAARGVPMNRLELSAAIGMRTDRMGGNGTLALLTGNGPGGTYTASLLKRGLLSKVTRGFLVSGLGKGRSRDLYFLGPFALEILQRRALCEKTDPTIP